MTGDESAHPPCPHLDPSRDRADAIGPALEDVIRTCRALISAIAQLAYAEAVRARTELEYALSRVESVVQTLPDGAWRVEAQRDLHETQSFVGRLLAIAPMPSPAAIEASKAGDETLHRQEERTWIETRRAKRSVPRIPRRRFPRATRPGTPSTVRDDRRGAVAATDEAPAVPRSRSSDPASDEADR